MPSLNPRLPALLVSVGVECNVGRERTENQDRVTRAATPFGDVFVVADGVGGHQGGAEAAQTTIDGFPAYLNASGEVPLPQALQLAVRAINADLQRISISNPVLHGMGSTVVLCVVNGSVATYAHMGDSRAYLLRQHKLKQLTRDHSVMERMMAEGLVTPAQAREHPDASVLTRALGQPSSRGLPDAPLDIGEVRLQAGDALLLCSDGLWAYAPHREIEAVAAAENLSASAVASALLNLALEGGGGDNIGIQFLRFEALHPPAKSKTILGMAPATAIPTLLLATVVLGGTVGLGIWNGQHSIDDPIGQAAKAASNAALASKPKDGTASGKDRISITIVQEKDKSVAGWASELEDLSYVKTARSAGTRECLALEQPRPTLLYSKPQTPIARRIQKSLAISPGDLRLLSPNELKSCGGGMIALPAKPSGSGG